MTIVLRAVEGDHPATFLQSAIVLDDQAFDFGPNEQVGTLVEPDAAPGRRTVSDKTRDVVEPETRQTKNNDLNLKALTDSFAGYGIVCGVLCPAESEVETLSERLLLTAGRADIVILDWQIRSDDGKAATDIIIALAQEDRVEQALKLVCVYTADRTNINRIISEIEGSLAEKLGGGAVRRISDYELVVGGLQIVLYSKVALDIQDQEVAGRYASEEALPSRIVADFERNTCGLLQRMAIRALSTLRLNTHSIAARFSSRLDPGYLWHRGALYEPEDAERHVREILASDFESIIERSDPGNASTSECGRFVDGLEEPLNRRFDLEPAVTYDDVKAVLVSGLAMSDASRGIRKKLQKHDPVARIVAFAESQEASNAANELFSMLMTLRAPSKGRRTLHLGTAVRSREDDAAVYYVCLQPLCDSTRLDAARRFPLLPIALVNGDRFNFVLPLGGEEYARFDIKYNPYRLVMREFRLAGGDSGDIMFSQRDGKFIVTDVEQREYEWLAELRSGIAHRIAQKLSNQFGRLGLDFPEWIREKEY